MEPILLNYPPQVAEQAVDGMMQQAEQDPNCDENKKAIFKDVQILVKFAISQLLPLPAPSGTGEHKN